MTLSMKFIIKLNIWNHGRKGSRETSGLIGMCGGDRQHNSLFGRCIFMKLIWVRFKIRISTLGFIYIRDIATQSPNELFFKLDITLRDWRSMTLLANDKVPHRNRKHRSYRSRSPAISDTRFRRDLS
ncbi:unnamed protein product [Rotaria magnacalcarata]|uniref:Uncharacterized protein n=1 Tax=Rotaria magnacalcarata TaxID=392030 RepID=A0A815HIJ0_9BILA|nr:unnamed protein product [Rotaria magnacalcarata]CAF1519374.1 unnamed protein product [Rotaria magnacalcarata]CAF2035865.1 unnamed protein product [Rotaria magnacalcarata]CAF2097014.1 unnamed protein product [Rotaria magnacalcarata]CAF2146689.1 unnamed protein product [Rotaria magnacalcarata]